MIDMSGMSFADRERRRLAQRRSIWIANKRRREENAAAGRCINETLRSTHGPATHGVRCQHCYDVHRHGAAAIRWLEGRK